ncbi:MAG: insulinase family protein [Rhodospirillales bacterium]|nr:insulinase family protein [Rhodospirillales bacterium]
MRRRSSLPVQERRLSRSRFVATALLLALVVCLAQPVAARSGLFNPQTFTLENGLQVVVVTDRRVPVVSHMLWYKVGAADEPEGHSGIAHLLEHLMFKGTPDVPQGEFSRIVSSNGGQENAFTSYDYTAFFQNIACDRLELVMRMEADRMRNLVLTPKQVAPEKQVVLEERSQRVDNDPGAILAEEAQAVQFLNHPYRRPIIGWQKEIAALSTEAVLDFYRRWYVPENAILVVTGDIDAAELRPLAERTYGRIGGAAVPSRLQLIEPDQRADRRVSLTDARVLQPMWSRSLRAPSYVWGETKHAYALQVLADILGGGATSRLYRSLVVDQALAVSAGAWYDPSRRGPSELSIQASPRPGVELGKLEKAIEAAVAELARSGPTEDEVARSKQRMLADAVYARDTYSTAAHIIGEALATGQTLADVEAWPARIAAVSRDEVTAAARLVLDGPSVTSLLIADPDAASAQAAQAPSPPAAGTTAGGIR